MASFVLVHGGGHGGWCYAKVKRRLEREGHEVFAPSLTGLAERSASLSPEVDLDFHIEDVAALLSYWDLREVILVGHSYGGMVVTGAGRPCRRPGRKARLPGRGQPEERPIAGRRRRIGDRGDPSDGRDRGRCRIWCFCPPTAPRRSTASTIRRTGHGPMHDSPAIPGSASNRSSVSPTRKPSRRSRNSTSSVSRPSPPATRG